MSGEGVMSGEAKALLTHPSATPVSLSGLINTDGVNTAEVMRLLVTCGDAILRLHNDVLDYIDTPDTLTALMLSQSLRKSAKAFDSYTAWLDNLPV